MPLWLVKLHISNFCSRFPIKHPDANKLIQPSSKTASAAPKQGLPLSYITWEGCCLHKQIYMMMLAISYGYGYRSIRRPPPVSYSSIIIKMNYSTGTRTRTSTNTSTWMTRPGPARPSARRTSSSTRRRRAQARHIHPSSSQAGQIQPGKQGTKVEPGGHQSRASERQALTHLRQLLMPTSRAQSFEKPENIRFSGKPE